VIASQRYLKLRGTPATPADLSRHDCITGPGLSGEAGWTFRRSGAVTSIQVKGRVQVASAEGVVACVKAGLGIAIASLWMCRAELERGELERILRDYELDPVEVHAVYPAGRRPSPKVRTFSDYLSAKLGTKIEANAGQ
jgi:DNA-binding transcriptional LysR family regulator